jgi:hypothetical protein
MEPGPLDIVRLLPIPKTVWIYTYIQKYSKNGILLVYQKHRWRAKNSMPTAQLN